MTERLADLNARIDGVTQLGAVVNAMRGIAAARAQQARNRLTAVDEYAQTLAQAIGTALTLAPAPEDGSSAPRRQCALVAFVAEQGFAGAYSERLFDAIAQDAAASSLLLVGTRGAAIARERGIASLWQDALPAHPDGVPQLAERIVQALLERIASGSVQSVRLLHAQAQPDHALHIVQRSLLPLDRQEFLPPSPAQQMPLLNLGAARLVAELGEDYLHAQICRAALHAFAAENDARMQAMASARTQIEHLLDTLQTRQRQLRQEEITAEIIELAAGAQAAG